MKRQYNKWKNSYYENLNVLYNIFLYEFKNINHTNKTEWNTPEHFDIFCKYIYAESE